MRPSHSPLETLRVFAKLGTICFGGPVAHLGYFHEEFVVRRKWLEERTYIDLVALCQSLPGPSSSQVGVAIGLHRAGWWGALAAWIGFTGPSALLMILFAYGLGHLGALDHAGWLAGLKLAALAVVARAVWQMARQFCAQRWTAFLAIASTLVMLTWSSSVAQLAALAGGGILGWLLFRRKSPPDSAAHAARLSLPYGNASGLVFLAFFSLLLIGLPLVVGAGTDSAIARLSGFYKAGALVFGGGHVILPLLQTAVVNPGWVGRDEFLAGYGAAQALPGPLFSFAAFLGTIMNTGLHGWWGGGLCLLAIYLPGVLLLFAALPFWESFRRGQNAPALLKGINAAVVGILAAALYRPVWTGAVHGPLDFLIGLAALLLLFARVPPWLVVAACALAGEILLA